MSNQSATGKRGPSPTPSPEFSVRMATQMDRFNFQLEMLEALPVDAVGCTLAGLNDKLAVVDERQKEFLSAHEDLIADYAAMLVDHEYLRDEVFTKYYRAYATFRDRVFEIQGQLTPPPHIQTHSRLPAIPLPTFSGDYKKWPAFSAYFTRLIMECSTLTDLERLVYLRGCLKGTPADLIEYLPPTEASLGLSWKLLTDRYDNKRLQIQSHLNSIYRLQPLTKKSAAGLNKLIITAMVAHRGLCSLGVGQNMGECMLVHHISRLLDPSTREDWEVSIAPSQDYPSFDQLEKFVTSRVRAQESIERDYPA